MNQQVIGDTLGMAPGLLPDKEGQIWMPQHLRSGLPRAGF